MAIIELNEAFNGRRGSLDQNAVREYTRVFIVRTNDSDDSPLDVLLPGNLVDFPGIPSIRDPYVDRNGNVDFGAICVKVSPVQRSDDPNVWDVTCEYSSDKGNIEQRDQTIDDPLARPPIFKISFNRYQRVVTVNAFDDLAAGPITNSSGEPFIPAPECDDSRVVVTMTRNDPWVDLFAVNAYQDAVNSDYFFGQPPGTWKVAVEADSVYENSEYYWKVTLTFEFRPLNVFSVLVQVEDDDGIFFVPGIAFDSAFHLALVDQGYMVLVPNAVTGKAEQTQYLDQFGNPPTSPVLLNGAGEVLPSGSPPYFIIVQVYNEIPFGPLNVPQVIF